MSDHFFTNKPIDKVSKPDKSMGESVDEPNVVHKSYIFLDEHFLTEYSKSEQYKDGFFIPVIANRVLEYVVMNRDDKLEVLTDTFIGESNVIAGRTIDGIELEMSYGTEKGLAFWNLRIYLPEGERVVFDISRETEYDRYTVRWKDADGSENVIIAVRWPDLVLLYLNDEYGELVTSQIEDVDFALTNLFDFLTSKELHQCSNKRKHFTLVGG